MADTAYQRLVWRAASLIDPSRPARGAPPTELWGFARWCISGAWPVIALAGFISALSGASEVLSMYVLGEVVDLTASDAPLGDALNGKHQQQSNEERKDAQCFGKRYTDKHCCGLARSSRWVS